MHRSGYRKYSNKSFIEYTYNVVRKPSAATLVRGQLRSSPASASPWSSTHTRLLWWSSCALRLRYLVSYLRLSLPISLYSSIMGTRFVSSRMRWLKAYCTLVPHGVHCTNLIVYSNISGCRWWGWRVDGWTLCPPSWIVGALTYFFWGHILLISDHHRCNVHIKLNWLPHGALYENVFFIFEYSSARVLTILKSIHTNPVKHAKN